MLSNRHILITGGSEGIGFSCAAIALKYGAKVVITGRKQEKLDAAKEKLGENCFTFACDATDPESVKKSVAYAVDAMGSLDGLVCNVGAARLGSIYELKDEDFDWTIKTCLYSCMYNVRDVSAYMVQNNIQGSIVNISSLNGTVPYAQYVPYCSAKGGINMLTKTAALDLGPKGIRINAVAPGFTHTPAQNGLYQAPPIVEEVVRHTPLLGHDIHPDEIGELVAFLLSNRAYAIHGEIITADCGMQNTAYPDLWRVTAQMMATMAEKQET